MRVLLAEDERDMARALEVILKHNHYSVDTVYNGQDAYDFALDSNYDGIILDVMMPGLSGFEVVRRIREQGITTPVLMLTARSDTEDKVTGLDLGADDYLTKPFEIKELIARVRALTRRGQDFSPVIMSYGNIDLSRTTFEIISESGSVKLGNKEFQIMEMLFSNPSRVIPTERFMEHIWGYDSMAEINVVWVYISNLRKKLSSISADIEIKASRGVGYSLEMKK